MSSDIIGMPSGITSTVIGHVLHLQRTVSIGHIAL